MATNSNQGGGNDRWNDESSQTLEVVRPGSSPTSRPLAPLSSIQSSRRRQTDLDERDRRLQASDDEDSTELRPGAVCVRQDEERRIHTHHLGQFALGKGEFTRERLNENVANVVENEDTQNESLPPVPNSEQRQSQIPTSSNPSAPGSAGRSPTRPEEHPLHGVSHTFAQSARVMAVLESLNAEEGVAIDKGSIFLCGNYAMGCIFICFVAIASGMIAFLFVEPSKGGNGIFVPTPSPTVVSFTTEALVGLIQARLPSTSFADPSSPQGRALDWLAHQDSHAHVVASNDDFFGNAIIQRFAMTTLYFALHGRHDKGNDGWLENVNECEWGVKEIVCDDFLGRAIELNLSASGLVGQIPPEIGLLTHLTKILFSANQITGTIPSEIGLLTELHLLKLDDNQLRGTIPGSIVHMTKLEQVTIPRNSMSGTLPSGMYNLSRLLFLYLEGNKLSGTIPTTFGSLTSLDTLVLNGNEFIGTLPSELGKLSDNLQFFLVADNYLKGTIPTEFGGLGALLNLELSDNEFSGIIPPELGNCHQMVDLNLSRNRLEGIVPTQILLPGLEKFNINDNRLNGTLPEAALSHLSSLVPGQLRLFRNRLQGSLPNTLCYANPEVDCSNVHCDCCRSFASIPCKKSGWV